jgi:hypothetical protein
LDYFLAEAEHNKAHARETLDALTIEPGVWIQTHIVLPAETLAARAYSYSYYRANMKGGYGGWGDKTARELWVSNGWIKE